MTISSQLNSTQCEQWKGGEGPVMDKRNFLLFQSKGSRKYFREIVLEGLKTNAFDVMPKFYVREYQ